jgi:hypothetical protein
VHQRIKTTLESARRLAVAKQGLSGSYRANQTLMMFLK